MVFITYKAESGLDKTQSWDPTETKPAIKTDAVVSVQADGHDLKNILIQFKNIPYHRTATVQMWEGDIAKFIWRHL